MTAHKQVLLVEDDEPARLMLERWFTDEGYDVVPCARFETARTYLSGHAPDILITDVRLGAFNGLQLIHIAKSAKPDTIAVVISGFSDPVLREEAERAGARYLVKPFNREDVLEIVESRTNSS